MIVRLIMVMSADGVIAKNSNQNPVQWTSKEDQNLFKETTKAAGALIMGQKTFDAIGFPLPDRLNVVLTEEQRADIPGKLEHRRGDIKTIVNDLAGRGFQMLCVCGGTFVNSLFLQENLLDEIQITLEPKIFGQGLRIFDKLDADLNLQLLELKKLNEHTVNLLYKIVK